MMRKNIFQALHAKIDNLTLLELGLWGLWSLLLKIISSQWIVDSNVFEQM